MDKIAECLHALSTVLGRTSKDIALHEPTFQGNEWSYVKDCLDSGWVSSVGEYINQFERKISEYTGVSHVVATVNGTAALHIALLVAGVLPEHEVLVPSLTFIATANAIIYSRAIPHFIDSDTSNLGINLEKLKKYLQEKTIIRNNHCINKDTKRVIKAIIPVHIFGHSIDMDALKKIAQEFCLTIIEDAAESLGTFYKEKHTGNFGEIAVLSFNGNKIISTGGGGAILSNNEEFAKLAKHLTTTAKIPSSFEFIHDRIGYNYRLPNINAALGCAQLEQISTFVEKKRKLAKKYQIAFRDIEYAEILTEPTFCKSNYWLNALILKQPDRSFIEKYIDTANQHHYKLRGLWHPIHTLSMYQHYPKMDLSNTCELFNRVISLPSSVCLGEKENLHSQGKSWAKSTSQKESHY
ncbi:MAG: LegC family aminotransferase [Candidatus Berkiella sp.]